MLSNRANAAMLSNRAESEAQTFSGGVEGVPTQ